MDEKKLLILVAEDDPGNQYLMECVLEGFGYSFDIVANGKEAVEKIERKKYDVVLMDLRMPVMDGYEAAKHIREKLDKDLPIIAVTAHALDYVEAECRDAGMNGFLTKPFDPERLKKEILKLVKR